MLCQHFLAVAPPPFHLNREALLTKKQPFSPNSKQLFHLPQNVEYQTQKRRFQELHAKLSHIKKLVVDYDQSH